MIGMRHVVVRRQDIAEEAGKPRLADDRPKLVTFGRRGWFGARTAGCRADMPPEVVRHREPVAVAFAQCADVDGKARRVARSGWRPRDLFYRSQFFGKGPRFVTGGGFFGLRIFLGCESGILMQKYLSLNAISCGFLSSNHTIVFACRA